MAAITTAQGEREFIDFNLTYSADWSVSGEAGQTVEAADVDTAYFFLKRNKSDSNTVLELDTDTTAEMEWIGNTLRVKLGANTLTLHGKYLYELRLKLTDGAYVSADTGTVTITESITGNPA